MPVYKVVPLILLACLVSFGRPAQNESLNRYIYKIRIPATTHHPDIIQTGFRLLGTKGIITALHGVIDGTIFIASNESGDSLRGLKMVMVDVNNDLALLRSEELENRPADGLPAVENLNITTGDGFRTLGHPEGINLHFKDDLRAGMPVMKELQKLIPPKSSDEFARRKSPWPYITVLDISSGNLGPGYSGAPVLNSRNQVVGIIDGGLRDYAISWAIPINTVKWQDISSVRTIVNEIAKLPTSNLFAFIEGKTENTAAPIYTYQISGSLNGEPLYQETRNHREEFSFQGSLRGYYLHVTQFTNGRPCASGEIKPPHGNFPPGSTNNDKGTPRIRFAGGVQSENRPGILVLLLNPGTTCDQ
jgi:Trypsin-like peptidase domain